MSIIRAALHSSYIPSKEADLQYDSLAKEHNIRSFVQFNSWHHSTSPGNHKDNDALHDLRLPSLHTWPNDHWILHLNDVTQLHTLKTASFQ